jgi:peptidoglycan/LPS O-acetylase OafA/YrhL
MVERPAAPGGKVPASGFPGLDGLRTLAVLLVILSHQFIWKLGWVGVQTFFVLSGYLITGILYRAREDTLSTYLRNFYGRRVLRIFPLYYAYLGGLALVFAFGKLPPTVGTRLSYAALYVANHYPVESDEGARLLWHFWSLAVEEQFYLVWPFLIYFCPQRLLRPLLLAIVAAGPAVRYVLTDQFPLGGYFTLTHLDAFALGALSVLYPWKLRQPLATLVCVGLGALGLIMLGNDQPFPGLKHGWGYMFGLSVFNAASAQLIELLVRREFLPRLFENAVVRYLGKISYGIYIFHFPVQTVIERLSPNASVPLRLFYQVAVTVALSAASYELFEVRFLVLKERWFPSRAALSPAAPARLAEPTQSR